MRSGFFPRATSEGFLLCRSSAGTELPFQASCRRVVAKMPPRWRRIENYDFPYENPDLGGLDSPHIDEESICPGVFEAKVYGYMDSPLIGGCMVIAHVARKGRLQIQ